MYEEISTIISPLVFFFLNKMHTMGRERHIPNISWNTADFFVRTLRQRPIRHVLEIGPANGFSTMILSLACPEAHITTIECSRHAFEELRINLSSFSSLRNSTSSDREIPLPADLPAKITSNVHQETSDIFSLYYGDAREILPAFVAGAPEAHCTHPASLIRDIPARTFDVIFIDGAFRMTRDFFDLSRPLLAAQGIIIIDDAIKYRWKMEGFHEYLESQGVTYELIQTDEDD